MSKPNRAITDEILLSAKKNVNDYNRGNIVKTFLESNVVRTPAKKLSVNTLRWWLVVKYFIENFMILVYTQQEMGMLGLAQPRPRHLSYILQPGKQQGH